MGGNDIDVVRVVHGMELDLRIAIDEAVQRVGTNGERGHHLAGVHGLARAIDHARVKEGKEAIGEHLGMDAEIAVGLQLAEDGVGDGANAHLEGCPVGDERRDVAAHFDGLGAGQLVG